MIVFLVFNLDLVVFCLFLADLVHCFLLLAVLPHLTYPYTNVDHKHYPTDQQTEPQGKQLKIDRIIELVKLIHGGPAVHGAVKHGNK